MDIIQMTLSETLDDDIVQFVKHIEETTRLDHLDCDVEIEETTENGYPAVKFTAYINEHELNEEDKFSIILQQLADEFYGLHEYVCGVYSDSHRSEVVISPDTVRN